MLETDSGRLPGGWSYYGRYSRIETQGYREQSWSKLWSYALAARRTLGSQSFRLNLYGGPEETHLAYLGVPRGLSRGRGQRGRRPRPALQPHHLRWRARPLLRAALRAHPHLGAARAGSRSRRPCSGSTARATTTSSASAAAWSEYRLGAWWTADSTLVPPRLLRAGHRPGRQPGARRARAACSVETLRSGAPPHRGQPSLRLDPAPARRARGRRAHGGRRAARPRRQALGRDRDGRRAAAGHRARTQVLRLPPAHALGRRSSCARNGSPIRACS